MNFVVDAQTRTVCLEQIKAAFVNFGERKLVIWGTREKGAFIKELLEESGYSCSFFVSSRPKTDTCCGLPLHTPEVLDVSRHYVFLATEASEVKEYLKEHGFVAQGERDCLQIGCAYYSCQFMENVHFMFEGWLGDVRKRIRFCCASVPNRPEVNWSTIDTSSEILWRFFAYRDHWVEESKQFNSCQPEEGRSLTAPCVGCSSYQKKNWLSDRRIHTTNLSMYPSPCQSKCFYCDLHSNGQTRWIETAEIRESYEKIFDLLERAKNDGAFQKGANWEIATGEIAIHPYREKILNLMGQDNARFYTNGMKYDNQIAKKLSENPRSEIVVSIDSGTSETWYKIKGVDNFEIVKENLLKYQKMCIDLEQIAIKYIVFPGINDSDADFLGAIDLLKQLKITRLEVSCDARPEHRDEKFRQDVIRSG
ncbi:MAG: radical SAM protein, partial [Oscillospiraceae bacterium]|nr:radical SAM protein [Oscillospiraceae bacterium]